MKVTIRTVNGTESFDVPKIKSVEDAIKDLEAARWLSLGSVVFRVDKIVWIKVEEPVQDSIAAGLKTPEQIRQERSES